MNSRLKYALLTLLAIAINAPALADRSMVLDPSSTSIEDMSLAEMLYPEVMSNVPKADPFPTPSLRNALLLAHEEHDEDAPPVDPKCVKFQDDPGADVGEILRAGCQPSLAQMSALMDNPLGNVAMLFTQFDFYVKKDPATGREDTQYNYMGIAQLPKKIGSNWNLINRVIWNVGSVPLDQDKIDDGFGSGPGGVPITPPPGDFPGAMPPINPPLPIDVFSGRTTGFGDMMYVGLFSPQQPIKTDLGGIFAWGLGFDVGLPTATEDILGSGKYTAGPSALAVYMGPKWKFGGLVTHFKDFASRDSSRADVNITNFQYFLFYSLSDTFSIGAAPNIICNWEQGSNNKCTVPIGIGFASTVNIGKVPVRFGAELHYSIVQPDDVLGTKWDFRFYVIPAAPSALFQWMN